MDDAEKKAGEVLGLGYAGTRYECWVHDQLASGYERLGQAGKAIAAYRRVLQTADPAKGTYTRAKTRIQALGGSVSR